MDANSFQIESDPGPCFPVPESVAKTARSRKKANGRKGGEMFHVSLSEDSASPQ